MKRCVILCALLMPFLEAVSFGCSNGETRAMPGNGASILTGAWVITKQTVSPLTITPFCKNIEKGCTFKFTETTFEVFIDSSANPCDIYRFKIGHNTISFIKEDMIWLCTFELTRNYLKLTSNNFFTTGKPGNISSLNKITAPQRVTIILQKILKPTK